MKKEQPEYILQKQVCSYLNSQYNKVLYLSDTIASIKLTFGQMNRNKAIQKEGFKTPDLLILHPNKEYHGLFIELKAKTIYKKDGTLLKNDHVEAQLETIKQLNKLGYYATFCIGFDNTKAVIDEYMKG